jgi:3-deoxy-D-manno-octulosonic-acid transferase
MMARVSIPPVSAGNRSAGQPPSKLTDATLVSQSLGKSCQVALTILHPRHGFALQKVKDSCKGTNSQIGVWDNVSRKPSKERMMKVLTAFELSVIVRALGNYQPDPSIPMDTEEWQAEVETADTLTAVFAELLNSQT